MQYLEILIILRFGWDVFNHYRLFEAVLHAVLVKLSSAEPTPYIHFSMPTTQLFGEVIHEISYVRGGSSLLRLHICDPVLVATVVKLHSSAKP